jgi:hypothetical protein
VCAHIQRSITQALHTLIDDRNNGNNPNKSIAVVIKPNTYDDDDNLRGCGHVRACASSAYRDPSSTEANIAALRENGDIRRAAASHTQLVRTLHQT